MRRNFLTGLAALGAFTMLATPSMAQIVSGDATSFIISLTSLELCSSAACSDPVALGSGATNFDIASAAVGASVGTYASTNNLPAGRTFTHVRTTLSRTIRISGNAGSPAGVVGDCITDGTAGATTGGAVLAPGATAVSSNLVVPDVLAIGGAGPTAAEYTAQGITLVDGTNFRFLTALSSSFTVGATPPNIDLAFQTQNAVGAVNDGTNNCEMFPQPPVVLLTLN